VSGRTGRRVALAILGLAVLALALWTLRRPAAPPAAGPTLAVGAVLSGGEQAGFARALGPRRFTFPADHGPHPEFRSEWWYVTGQLRAGERRFGYQFTIFRQALAPAAPPRPSAWASRQVYLGHLAVSDIGAGRFDSFERVAREGLGLGGAQAVPLRVWVEDWSLEREGQVDGLFPLRLRARADNEGRTVTLSLSLEPGRGPVLQGDAGLSAKGPEPGNASYYYSMTRLPTRGRLTLDGVAFDVEGQSWLDREWSTSALGPELEGWDWLALHLLDGRDVMVYRLRRRDGTPVAQSRATIIAADGQTRVFDAFTLTPLAWWRSPGSGVRYPVSMRLTVPAAALTLEVRPLLQDQELRVSVRYWEGAVEAFAPRLAGSGYLELTGYGSR
jgi:predicted secreted hydrolase